MRQCLTSPDGGYYTRQNTEGRDQFGAKGDFITSPEISQVFGELVGVWVIAEWMAQGRVKPMQLVELGPGRGTLMSDMLRTLRQFRPSISDVYLVEASEALRQKQWKQLCDSPLESNGVGWEARSKFFPNSKVIWVEEMMSVPRSQDATPFIVAHEFFDALPIHAFQAVESKSQGLTVSTTPGAASRRQNEWRELLVAPTSPHSGLANPKTSPSSQEDSNPEFTLTVSKEPTPFSQYLPNISDRYKSILATTGATIEISPESLTLAADIAIRIGGSPSGSAASSAASKEPKHEPSGAALILDYGPADTIPAHSLRGIRNHRVVSPFSAPGLVDLSVDVDFTALAEAALDASPGVDVHSPVEQATFLAAMGIKERSEVLIREAERRDDEEGAGRIESAWKRLVDRNPQGMGRLYKAMAIVPHQEGKIRRPVGFGGDVNV